MPRDDVNFKGILGFLGILAATLALIYLILTVMWRHLEKNARQEDLRALRQGPAPAVASTRPYFPLPREQPAPLADLEELRAREKAELNSYGWIEKSNGIVRIPIDRAIELMSQPAKATP
jgi:hypothetical protein